MDEPVPVIVPTFEFPPLTESTDHVTPVLVGCTVAVNCAEAPVVTVVELGEIETVTTGTVTVTCALAVWVVSAALVAVTVDVAA
jgi:hypothetical protein